MPAKKLNLVLNVMSIVDGKCRMCVKMMIFVFACENARRF